MIYRDRVMLAAEGLQALAAELDDTELVLDPVHAVVCTRLVAFVRSDPGSRPVRAAA